MEHCECCVAFEDDLKYVKSLETSVKSLTLEVECGRQASARHQERIIELQKTHREMKTLITSVHNRLLQAGIMLDGLDLSLLLRIS